MISPILDVNAHVEILDINAHIEMPDNDAHIEEPDDNAQSRIFKGVDTRRTLSCQESGISPVVVGQP